MADRASAQEGEDEGARLNREIDELLATAIAHRSPRIAQDAGGRVAKVIVTALAHREARNDRATVGEEVEGVCAASNKIIGTLRDRGAEALLPADFTRDLQEAAVVAFWRIMAPRVAARLGTPS